MEATTKTYPCVLRLQQETMHSRDSNAHTACCIRGQCTVEAATRLWFASVGVRLVPGWEAGQLCHVGVAVWVQASYSFGSYVDPAAAVQQVRFGVRKLACGAGLTAVHPPAAHMHGCRGVLLLLACHLQVEKVDLGAFTAVLPPPHARCMQA